MDTEGPILRVFEVRAKPGCAGRLLENFATTSAKVVRNEPGNSGYFFGRTVAGDDENTVIFVSVWKDMAAVRSRFGSDWQSSYMPDGYDELIDECSVRHVCASGGWHVDRL